MNTTEEVQKMQSLPSFSNSRLVFIFLLAIGMPLMILRQSHRITDKNLLVADTVTRPQPTSAPLLPTRPWNKTNAIFPISFGLPSNRFSRANHWKNHSKTRDFAHIIPGVPETYVYSTEEEYYDGYADSFFSITRKKGGWDCFRHYEIIASGSMPYFLDIASIPKGVMFDYPTSIVREAMELPGVPSQAEVNRYAAQNSTELLAINHTIFNATEYSRLMDALVAYSYEHLTWSGKVRYMLSQIRGLYPCMEDDPRILMVTIDECEYQSCVVFGGVYELFGAERMSSYFGPKVPLFSSLPHPKQLYGNGYSYENAFSDEWNTTRMDQLTQERLRDGFFNMIIFMNGRNKYCELGKYFYHRRSEAKILVDYQKRYNPIVVAVDGSDEIGCHDLLAGKTVTLEYHSLFVREFHRAQSTKLTKWSGCENSTERS